LRAQPDPDDPVARDEQLPVLPRAGVELGKVPGGRLDERGETVAHHPGSNEPVPWNEAWLQNEAVAFHVLPVAERAGGAAAYEPRGVEGERQGSHDQRRDHDPTAAAQERPTRRHRATRAATANRPVGAGTLSATIRPSRSGR
jgi:hypothetical protein